MAKPFETRDDWLALESTLREDLGDLVALFAISLIGILLRRFDWSRPAFLIGFVLSNPAEAFTNQAHQVARFKFEQSIDVGMAYIFSPIVIVLIVITVVSIVVGIRQAKHIMTEGDIQSKSKRAPMIFLLAYNSRKTDIWRILGLLTIIADLALQVIFHAHTVHQAVLFHLRLAYFVPAHLLPHYNESVSG